MKLCNEAGLIIHSDNGPILDEAKLFRGLSYQEVLDLDMESLGTIDRGQVRISDVENYLSRRVDNQ
jgi:hypothetical protein